MNANARGLDGTVTGGYEWTMAEDADLLFLAFALRDDAVDEDAAVNRLVEAAGGSTAELRTAYERAWALAHSTTDDPRVHQLVEFITKALRRATEVEVARAAELAEISPVFRSRSQARRPVTTEQAGPRTLADRLADAARDRGEVIDIDQLTADLDRLRASSASDDGSRRRRR